MEPRAPDKFDNKYQSVSYWFLNLCIRRKDGLMPSVNICGRHLQLWPAFAGVAGILIDIPNKQFA
tara:strand:+ start:440 stop:634 length:195 start_codon:yes stop_codon:yes gene_type:complete